MQIEHTVTHIVPSMGESGGGPPRSVGQLCDHLVRKVAVNLVTADDPEDPLVRLNSRIQMHFVQGENRTMLGRLSASGFTDLLKQLHAHAPLTLCHQHGIWLRSSHETTQFTHRNNIPLIVAPRGMLEPWTLESKRWKKKLAWALYQKRDLEKATAFHATAQSEADSIRRLGLKQPIAVIPNGVELPELKRQKTKVRGPQKTALFLSRINPKKGLLMLLDAWKQVAPEGWRLVLAGNDDANHLPEVKSKIRELGLQEQVEIAGPLFGEAKEAIYRNADLFVLPSYSENFGIVVAEALSYCVPVLTTTGCPWKELQTHNCGWWVEPTPAGIECGLVAALGTGSQGLFEMGMNGRALVEEKYQWPGIAEKMLTFYDWLLKGGKQPKFIV